MNRDAAAVACENAAAVEAENSAAGGAAGESPLELVERALLRRACGYEHCEDTLAFGPEGEATLVKRVIKHVVPDISAIKFWLSSRAPERWGGVRDDAEGGGVVVLPAILDDP